MEQLPSGYTLHVPEGAFPLSTDSMALAHFVKLPRAAKVLDLGSGCGTLGLLLCASDPGCTVSGIELEEAAHQAALENIRRNSLQDRLRSIHGDLRQSLQILSPGSFSVCVSNPPYFSGGPASGTVPLARRTDTCPVGALFSAAARALKYGGDFFLVHRPECMAKLIAAGAASGLEAKRLCLLRHREGQPVSLVLLQFRKGGKPGLLWEEWCLHHLDGTPTDIYRSIYHI